MKRLFLATVGLLTAVSGCGGGSDLMPMEVGQSRSYLVNAGFDTYVTQLTVARSLSVGGTRGFELTSALGSSRIAWDGDALVADRLVHSQFDPPLPILFDTEETHDRSWKGRVVFVDRSSPASATQSQSIDNDLNFAGKKIRCIRSVVRLRTAARSIELITWFSEGLGIVQQEQRTDEKLVLKLRLLSEKQ